MEQYAPESLSPSILPEAQGALEVGQKRQAIELELGKVKAAKDAEKAKARSEVKKSIPSPDTFYFMQHQNGKKVYNNLLDGMTALERQAAENPDNPDFDPYVIGSKANIQMDALIYEVNSFAKRSQEVGKVYETAMTTYANRTDIDPQFFIDIDEWAKSPGAIDGSVPRPDPRAYFDQSKLREEALKIQPSKTAWSNVEGDVIASGSKAVVTEADVWSWAKGKTNDEAVKRGMEYAYEQLDPTKKAYIDKLAQDNNTDVISALIFDNNKEVVRTSDATSSKTMIGHLTKGTGFQNVDESSNWLADAISGMAEGKSDLFRPVTVNSGSVPEGSYYDAGVKDKVDAVMEAAGIPKGTSRESAYNAWVRAGRPENFEVTTDLSGYPVDKSTAKIGDKVLEINFVPTAIVAVTKPDGTKTYTQVIEPDVSSFEKVAEREAVIAMFEPRFKTVDQSEISTELWKGTTTVGNKNVNPGTVKKRMNEKGHTYEGTSGRWVGPEGKGGDYDDL